MKKTFLPLCLLLALVLLASAVPQAALADGTNSLTVTVKLGGTPLSGYMVSLYSSDQTLADQQWTNANGEAIFTGLEDGDYLVSRTTYDRAGEHCYVRHQGLDIDWYSITMSDSCQKTYTLDCGEHKAGVIVWVNVMNASGEPIDSNSVKWNYGSTDGNIFGYADGKYRLSLYRPEAGTTDTVTLSADEITVDNGTSVVTYEAASASLEISADKVFYTQDIVLSTAAVTRYPLWVDGEQVTDLNLNDVLGDGGSVAYDPDTYTLTLTEAHLSKGFAFDSTGNFHFSGTAAILSELNSLTVSLVGDSTVSSSYDKETGEATVEYGIVANDLTVRSSDDAFGSLTMAADGRFEGITAVGNLTVSETSLSILSTDENERYSVLINGDTVSIAGARVNLSRGYEGIYGSSSVKITGGSVVDIVDCHYGIGTSDSGSFRIEASDVTISADALCLEPWNNTGFSYEEVDVIAGTDKSGANAAAYDESALDTYRYLKTTAARETKFTLNVRLTVTDAYGGTVPETVFAFTAAPTGSFAEYFSALTDFTVSDITVDQTGVFDGTVVFMISPHAADLVLKYGSLETRVASVTPSDNWTVTVDADTLSIPNDKWIMDLAATYRALPQTGDESRPGLWLALLALAGVGLAGTLLFGRKKRLGNKA